MSLLASANVCCLQGIHGGTASLELLLPHLSPSFVLHVSPGSEAAAGVLTLFRRSAFDPLASFSFEEIVPGRVLLSTIRVGPASTHFLDVHNFALSAADLAKMQRVIRPLLREARRHPSHCVLVAAGDWNFLADDEAPIDLKTGLPTFSSQPRRGQLAIAPLLAEMIELTDLSLTHFNKALGHCSRIDRVFITLPRWQIIQLHCIAGATSDPIALEGKCLSDHSPVRASISLRRPSPAPLRPIAPYIFRDRRFKPMLDHYLMHLDLPSLTPPAQYRVLSVALRAAAERVRDMLSKPACPTQAQQIMILAAVSRVVVQQRLPVARTLLADSPFAARFLKIVGSTVALIDPVAFDNTFTRLRSSPPSPRPSSTIGEVKGRG